MKLPHGFQNYPALIRSSPRCFTSIFKSNHSHSSKQLVSQPTHSSQSWPRWQSSTLHLTSSWHEIENKKVTRLRNVFDVFVFFFDSHSFRTFLSLSVIHHQKLLTRQKNFTFKVLLKFFTTGREMTE